MIMFIAVIMFYFIFKFITKQKKHQETLQELKIEFEQQSLQSRLEIQEQTFTAISEEIHDNVGQILSLAKVQLNILDEQWPSAPSLLKDSKENISRAMTDLRDIASSLNADRMEQLKLADAVAHETERLNKLRAINCTLIINGEEQKIESRKKLIAFRIIQEALNNVLKHAQATLVNIHFEYTNDFFIIDITDNGKGFDRSLNRSHGLGLENISKRTALIGGEAIIQSEINKGTTITLHIPYV
jgi:two-component system NarL family sensor kinase